MSRAELWKALGEATDAVQAAGDEYTRASTPQARAAMDAAFREYVGRLTPVIGTAAASRYEASLGQLRSGARSRGGAERDAQRVAIHG